MRVEAQILVEIIDDPKILQKSTHFWKTTHLKENFTHVWLESLRPDVKYDKVASFISQIQKMIS